MAFNDWDGFEYYPPSRPRAAKGGIKAATQRGNFGERWWARRWIQVLESFDIGARLQRGRSYARHGQVLSIDIKQGVVKARVQGSRPQPYQVTVEVSPLKASEWKRVAEQLSKQALFAAKLLAGEMPQEIERAFADAGVSLFPKKLNDLSTDCSCPDWSNPCKHVAAVYYLLGEAFDQDPFLLFRLRGLNRDQFLSLLSESRVNEPETASPVEPEPEPLPIKPEEFWGARMLPPDLFGEAIVPATMAGLPRRLGSLPFWRGELPLVTSLELSYQNASRKGEQMLWGTGESSDKLQ
jgi:uncharacterized Zn finger protein